MNFFIDTSALVKLYHFENGSEELERFINKHFDLKGKIIITISEISTIEFYSVFLKRLRKGEISNSELRNLFDNFRKHLLFYNVIKINDTIRTTVIELLLNYGREYALYSLDSIQLSSAIFSTQLFSIDYFISSDKTLLNIAQSYLKIYNPEV